MILAIILLLSGLSHFFYDCEGLDYSNQELWGGTCTSGYNQSPIDISLNSELLKGELVGASLFWCREREKERERTRGRGRGGDGRKGEREE